MTAKCLLEKCINCNICKDYVTCPVGNVKRSIKNGKCIGCGACVISCPEKALVLENNFQKKEEYEKSMTVFVNNKKIIASGTVKDALKASDIKLSKFPDFTNEIKDQIFIPCECGGCWTCLVLVNGKPAPSCITPLQDGMKIETIVPKQKYPLLRVISSFGAHTVGGVGTPYWLKNKKGPIEVVGFTHGCNLRCPQCQNFPMAFTAGGHLLDPYEASNILLGLKEVNEVNRIVISGGESTLNRIWLLELIKSIKNQDNDVHIHVDTNGTILTPDYIDALVDAGMTDIGIDLKSINVSTYMEITGLDNLELAKKYLQTSWDAVEYIIKNYLDRVFLGIGIPYNKSLISKEEIKGIGKMIFKMKPDIQVCILDYRPEFRRKDLFKPSFEDMVEIKEILNDTGLETVIVQTDKGHFGP
ncbi:radical SAM protein [Methanobacterium sp.]|uniref:radical SAM protein n=1 Tax=Methanobacterium sp. TaxID=2164 RepID=UPI003C74763F